MILEKQIEKIGLPRNQARIYFCLLQNGPQFLQELSKNTDIKRTTLYPIIEKMVENNLLEIEIDKKRKKYYIKDPKNLLLQLREQSYLLEALMPQLENIFKEKSGENKIRFYDTINGLKETLKEINKINSEKDEVLTIESNIRESFKIGYEFWKDILDEKKRLGIKSRTIIPAKEANEFIIRDHAIKIRTSTMLTDFNITIYLFMNKTIIMIPVDSLCIVIENKKIKDAINCLFEIIWRRAKPIN